MMHNWDTPWNSGTSWEAWLMFALMVIVAVGVVVAIVYLTRAASGASTTGSTPRDPAEPPRDILQRRYAAGEIDRDEYQQKLADLQAGQGGATRDAP